jgi:hypothetical protein
VPTGWSARLTVLFGLKRPVPDTANEDIGQPTLKEIRTRRVIVQTGIFPPDDGRPPVYACLN